MQIGQPDTRSAALSLPTLPIFITLD